MTLTIVVAGALGFLVFCLLILLAGTYVFYRLGLAVDSSPWHPGLGPRPGVGPRGV